MLREVEPKYHHFYRSQIRDLRELLKQRQRLDLCETEQADCTFLIADNKAWGVYGGAVLFKKKLRNLFQKRGEISYSSTLQKEKIDLRALDRVVWSCNVVLCLGSKASSLLKEEREVLYREFYEELYQKLLELGAKEKTLYLCLTLDPKSYNSLEALGSFPFFSKSKPQESKDGLFYGLLLLVKNHFKSSNQNWSSPIHSLHQGRMS